MQKNERFTLLVSYFESIAITHRQILHRPDKKHFYRFELDEVLTGINGINYPALIMEGYRFGFSDNQSDNVQKKREGAFILLDHVNDAGDYRRIHEVWDNLEVIGDDIIRRIRKDKRTSANPVAGFNIESVKASLIATEMGNHYGIRFLFEIDSKFSTDEIAENWI